MHMARPAKLPAPIRLTTSSAYRTDDGEIDWGQMAWGSNENKPYPCYMHAGYEAPETGVCLHHDCIDYAARRLAKASPACSVVIRTLRAIYRSKGLKSQDLASDLAADMVVGYIEHDIPVAHHVIPLLRAGRRLLHHYQSDDALAMRSNLIHDDLEALDVHLREVVQMSYLAMSEPTLYRPDQIVTKLDLIRATLGVPDEVLAYLFGELSEADAVRLGISNRQAEQAAGVIRRLYLSGEYDEVEA